MRKLRRPLRRRIHKNVPVDAGLWLLTLKVLHVSPSYFPATYWGGPIYSMLYLNNALAALGLEVRVLATDAAGPRLGDRLDVSVGEPVVVASGHSVYYSKRIAGASISARLLMRLAPLARWADIVHLTGVYSFPTIPTISVCRALGKPVVWSLRGSLQRWSNSTRPRLKSGWNYICRQLVRNTPCVLHVTSAEEMAESQSQMPALDTALIPNGVNVPASLPGRDWKAGGVLHVLYLGRLDPKKGIENLIHAMASLERTAAVLSIRGSGNPDYVSSLRTLVGERRLEGRISFDGFAPEPEKAVSFQRADVCLVPSHTENFGLVVAESLAHGVPVIASTGTPWQELEQHECGFWVDNSAASLASAIERISKFDLQAMGQRGRAWMQRDYQWSSIAVRFRELYGKLVDRPGTGPG